MFSPVKKFTLENNIPLVQPERISRELELVMPYKPDVIVTCAFGQILKQNVLDLCKYGVINVHASLLPKYRGSSPIQWAIIKGEKTTGITIAQTELGLDTGDILHAVPCDIGDTETAGELFVRLSNIGATALLEALEQIEKGTVKRTPQNHTEATHYPMLKKEDGKIDLSKDPFEIVNLVRGLNPWPMAYVSSSIGDIRVHRASVVDGKLQFDTVQPPNKRQMTYKDFINGYKHIQFN